MAGWTEFSTGNTTAYHWFMGTTAMYVSSPNALASPSTEFAPVTDTPVLWYVSPGFNFHTGGKIDSFAINIWRPGTAQPSDSMVLYLLQGSNNPTLATQKIKLADLTHMNTSDNLFRDTGNFIIPATTGTSYIAFKYYSVNDWYVATIDNIHISGNPTGINEIEEGDGISFYPNPASGKINLSYGNMFLTRVWLTDLLGNVIVDFPPQSKVLDIAQVAAGCYFLSFSTGNEKITKPVIVQK